MASSLGRRVAWVARGEQGEQPSVDLNNPALVQALARLLYEAEQRRERIRKLRDPDR